MSVPKRFFSENINYPETTETELVGEEFNHARNVLRVEEGSEIVLLDNRGNEYAGIVSKVKKSSLSVHITGAFKGEKEPKKEIYLLCGALKGDKTELAVQKATELGVSRIGVFSSEYCSAYMNENKLARLNKVAREAAKQCLRSCAPEVLYFNDFQSALRSAAGYAGKYMACEFIEEGEVSLSSAVFPAAVAVGSEGGFSEEEFALAKKEGFAGITLGRRILRAETACVAAVALLAYFAGELQ